MRSSVKTVYFTVLLSFFPSFSALKGIFPFKELEERIFNSMDPVKIDSTLFVPVPLCGVWTIHFLCLHSLGLFFFFFLNFY